MGLNESCSGMEGSLHFGVSTKIESNNLIIIILSNTSTLSVPSWWARSGPDTHDHSTRNYINMNCKLMTIHLNWTFFIQYNPLIEWIQNLHEDSHVCIIRNIQVLSSTVPSDAETKRTSSITPRNPGLLTWQVSTLPSVFLGSSWHSDLSETIIFPSG